MSTSNADQLDSLIAPSVQPDSGEVAASRIVLVAGLPNEADLARLQALLPPGAARA